MKKTIAISMLLLGSLAINAQNYVMPDGRIFSREFIDVPAIILVVYLISMIILTIIKLILDHRLKSKMIEKGVSENVAAQFLQPTKKDSKNNAMKWFLILTGIGIGLTTIYFFLPIGIHSVAIMAFSIALSFLGYFYFLRQSEK